jgi:hypothetical protein
MGILQGDRGSTLKARYMIEDTKVPFLVHRTSWREREREREREHFCAGRVSLVSESVLVSSVMVQK